jgi:hypothetical protein
LLAVYRSYAADGEANAGPEPEGGPP